MNETTTKPEIITDQHIDAINAARDALNQIAEAATSAAWDAPGQARLDGPYAHWYGEVSAHAQLADDALFNLLNRAASTKIAVLTDEQLFNRPADEREPDGQRIEAGHWIPTDR